MDRSFLLLTALLLACDKDPSPADDSASELTDADSDGFAEDVDCDDSDAAVHPSAAEVCDLIDNDCDGDIDEDVTITAYADADGDGYGDSADSVDACSAPEGYIADNTDCDDSDAAVHPSAAEVCDLIDNDCDDQVDEDVTITFYADADGDGYGSDDATERCAAGDGEVEVAGDCDDSDSSIHPSAAEICDFIDNDCDSGTTEDGTASFVSDAGAWSDFSSALTGAVTLSEAGTLYICAGTWAVNLTTDADLAIVGAGPTQTVLDGDSAGTVITAGADLDLQGLAITAGAADNLNEGYQAGGGLYCDGNNTITGDDLLFSGNSAGIGGGLMAEDCDITLSDVEFSGNSADYGGGINLASGTLSISGGLLDANSASTSGGALYSGRAESTITITDTQISDNTARYGGGVLLTNAAELACEDSSFLANSADYGGAIRSGTRFTGTITFDACDLGEAGSADDNLPADLYIGGQAYTYGDGASFSCDPDGCE